MFQAVKTKLNNLLSPILDPVEPNSRKIRKRTLGSATESAHIPPAKRKKSAEHHSVNSTSTLNRKFSEFYNYVISGNFFNKHQTVQEERNLHRHDKRKYLNANRRMNISKRTPLSQISNATLLDLTLEDEDDENEDKKNQIQTVVSKRHTKKTLSQISNADVLDLTLEDDSESETKVDTYIDLTKPNQVQHKATIKKISQRKTTSCLHDSIRMEERKRYKELLAQYTTESLPEYSNSISPKDESKTLERINKISLLSERKERSFQIDLSDTSDTPLRRRKFYHEILNEASSPSFLDYSYSKPGSKSFSTSPRFTRSCSSLNQRHSNTPQQTEIDLTPVAKKTSESTLLDVEWIRKWRDTLDPSQLERERLICVEERKHEEIKSRQKAEFERLQKELEKSKSNDFPELTDEILCKVKNALSSGRSNEVLVQAFNTEITRQDIATLREATWLNDEVVNFYFNLLKERSEKDTNLPKVHVFNTFFYPKIIKVGHSGVKRWTRKVDIFACDLILIPVHLGMHWCLAVIDFKGKQIVYYDSLKGNNMQCIQSLKKYLQDESLDKKKQQFDLSGWSEMMPKDIPEQLNGCDCGVFMCKYAEYQSRCVPLTFAQKNMPYFRKRMIYEILSKKLM